MFQVIEVKPPEADRYTEQAGAYEVIDGHQFSPGRACYQLDEELTQYDDSQLAKAVQGEMVLDGRAWHIGAVGEALK